MSAAKSIEIYAVMATVDGKPAVLMLDSGAGLSALCSKVAQEVGMQVIAPRPNDFRSKGQIERAYRLLECQFQRQVGVAEEILALRRIQEFECDGDLNLGAGMWEFDRYITMQLSDGLLVATVDFYSQDFYSREPQGRFDDEAWEEQKMHLECIPSRENFYELYSMCRGLLKGNCIVFSDGVETSRELHLAEVLGAKA